MACNDKFPIYSHANSDSRYLFKLHPLLTYHSFSKAHICNSASGNLTNRPVIVRKTKFYIQIPGGGGYPNRPYVPVFQPTPQQIPHPLSSAIQNHLSYKIVCNPLFPISPHPTPSGDTSGQKGTKREKMGKMHFPFLFTPSCDTLLFFPLLFSHHFFFFSIRNHGFHI